VGTTPNVGLMASMSPEQAPAVEQANINNKTEKSGVSLLQQIKRTTSRTLESRDRGGSTLRRPKNGVEWFRSKADYEHPVFMLDTYEMAGSGVYVVTEEVAKALGNSAYDGILRACVNLDGNVFLAPLRVSDSDWSTSLAEAMIAAEMDWVQLASNRGEGRYTWRTPIEPVREPVWPNRSWSDILEASLKNHVISSVDHALVQKILNAKA
jgi:hypothetical protein